MSSRERVYASLEGRPVDRFPVTSLYHQLYRMDHFSELTGLPGWRMHEWLCASPEGYLELFEGMQGKTPFELLQPHEAPDRETRDALEFLERDGHGWRRDKRTGDLEPVGEATVSGHATDYQANETQYVFSEEDVQSRMKVTRAEEMIARGRNDYARAVVERYGDDQFIITGGVVGTFYQCHQHVGLMNLMMVALEQPGLVEYLSQTVLEQNIETIRCLAAAGGDAIYIDDAMTTNDLISVGMFERLSLPYMREMVAEIHSLGLKAILIYFGGVADRLEQIASLGADALCVEASMKGYVNDIGEIAESIGDRITLLGNLDPVGVLEQAGDQALERVVLQQVAAGRKARGFIVSTASPITPGTPLSRVRRFLDLARQHGVGER